MIQELSPLQLCLYTDGTVNASTMNVGPIHASFLTVINNGSINTASVTVSNNVAVSGIWLFNGTYLESS